MLRVHEISKTYGNGFVGLHPVSLEFNAGDFIVLLGKSGAGKSTLLRCLNHLNVPTSGHLEVDGIGKITSRKLLRQHRLRTAMIFQQHQLIARHTALQNVLVARVGFHSSLRGLAPYPREERRLALECLERVGLMDKAANRVDSLSGGQQQRVGIARALAQKPRIILADEPVASLDPGTSHSVLSQLRDICREDGILLVVSLHQVELAKDYADRIIALSGGRITFDGLPELLTEHNLKSIYESGEVITEPRITQPVGRECRA
ncbi:MAG: phosphonate ABC transporter ATP-binding protein [Oceanidesulfovibrio sp.]